MTAFKDNNICKLFNIKYPIIQGGMVWVSGAKLAAACSNSGGLGIIGAGSMNPALLERHILKTQDLTDKPFGVNIPLLYKDVEAQIKIALSLGVKIFFTSAGSPKKYTKYLKDHGAIVTHVTSSPVLAKKCEAAGVDAVVAEGFEAGGHNGREEITTMVLIPQVRDAISIPLIAAGGICDSRQITASLALGADAVQIGSLFACTKESSAHDNFKNAIVNADFGDTRLAMKKTIPVRLLKNSFANQIFELEQKGASLEELNALLGKGRAKLGMLDGDMDEGELEIGQASAMINTIPSVQEVFDTLTENF